MRSRRLVDTNLIVRHLTQDNAKLSEIADKLFAASDRGELTLVVLPAVLAESVFVLESFYTFSRARISDALRTLISSPGIELVDLPVHLNALDRYRKGKAHFIDCVIASFAVAHKLAVATFDEGFGKFSDVRVETD